MKKMICLVLAAMLLTASAVTLAEDDTKLATATDLAAETEITESAEAAEPAEEETVARKVRLVCQNKEIAMGDTVTLKAKLTGFDDAEVTIVWQYLDTENVAEDEEPQWVTRQVGGEKLTFTMTEGMQNVDWRVLVETND